MSVGWQQLSLRWVADTRGVIRAKPGGPFPVMEGRGSVTLLHQEDGLREARRWGTSEVIRPDLLAGGRSWLLWHREVERWV